MIQFLIDEDVTPRLHGVAVARGYNTVLMVDEDGRVTHFQIP